MFCMTFTLPGSIAMSKAPLAVDGGSGTGRLRLDLVVGWGLAGSGKVTLRVVEPDDCAPGRPGGGCSGRGPVILGLSESFQ